MNKKTVIGIVVLLFVISFVVAQGHLGGRPPEEAMVACDGKNVGDACSFEGLRGTEAGVCDTTPNGVACKPSDGGQTALEINDDSDGAEKKGFFKRFFSWLAGLFGRESYSDDNKLSDQNEKFIGNKNENLEFKATIIGSGGPGYNPERNGPSVLISNGAQEILVDLGDGTQSELNKIDTTIRSISGFFLTHHHIDHNEELVPIFISSLVSGNEFIIAGPPGTQNFIAITENLYEEDIAYRLGNTGRTIENVEENYEVKDLEGGESFSHAGMEISTTEVNHTIYTIAYRFDVNDKSIVISGDLVYSPSLSELAKDADVLIIDSGLVIRKGESERNNQNTNTQQNNGNRRVRAHSSLDEIGRMAKDANVKTLVLTHFAMGEVDEDATRKAIAEYFLGEIIFAYDLMEIIP